MRIRIILLIVAGILMQGCATQNLFESNNPCEGVAFDKNFHQEVTHYIQPDDKLSISIWNHDDISVGSLFGIYNSNEVYGKWILVNELGEVQLPKVGVVKLGGLDADQAAEKLIEVYGKYIVDPVIVVKVLNREVTVLGEVMTPGAYLLEKEKNTLFEILGKAGGLDFYADKTKVKFIRNDVEYCLDLTQMDQFRQNNIILQTGDIIYVPTRKGKTIDKKAPTIIPFASAITAIVLIYTVANQ